MTDDARARRIQFAGAHIRDAQQRGVLPAYGSTGWHNLDYADPRRWAAVLVAAEAWADQGDHLAEHLAVELESAAALEEADRRWFRDVAQSVRNLANGRWPTAPKRVDTVKSVRT